MRCRSTAVATALWLAACNSGPPPPPAPVVQQPQAASIPDDPGPGPSWSLPQERRAPKMPDAEKRWKTLEAPTHADAFDDGLLICSVQIASRAHPDHFPWGGWHPPMDYDENDKQKGGDRGDWDTINGPDALFNFRFGRAPVVSLWGPEDHWAMFISIPRVTLHGGDSIKVDVWDRDMTTNEYISTIDAKFDGQFPLKLEAKWLRLDCRGVETKQARAWAEPWAHDIDEEIGSIERAVPDPLDFDLNRPSTSLEDSYRFLSKGSFRYYAGYLGWDDHEVAARLDRYARAQASFGPKVTAMFEMLAKSATPSGVFAPVGKGWSMQVSPRACAGPPSKWRCLLIEARADKGSLPGCTAGGDGRIGDATLVMPDERGQHFDHRIEVLDDADRLAPCAGKPARRFVVSGRPPLGDFVMVAGKPPRVWRP